MAHASLLVLELFRLQRYVLMDADLLAHANRETRNLPIFSWPLRVTEFLKNFFPGGNAERIH